jgi:PAS domain S-box-containing protein
LTSVLPYRSILNKANLSSSPIGKRKKTNGSIVPDKEAFLQKKSKEKKAPQLLVPTVIDSTEPKIDEKYIGHLAAIVESSDDAIISKSLDGIIKSWNKGGEKMFGYTAEQAIGKHISLIIPTEYISEEKKIVDKIRNNEIIDHYDTVRRKQNGELLHVSLTVSPIKDPEGRIIGISKIARDVTSREKYEAELVGVNKQLVFQNEEKEKRAAELFIANKELAFQNEEKEKRATELIVANKELVFQNEEKEKRTAELTIANKELEQLTYIASHDLQEPLRTISNYMQVFEEDYSEKLDKDGRNYIRSVNNAANRMSILVRALLDFSLLGRDKKLTLVDCKKLILDVIADLQAKIKASDTTIDVGDMPALNIYEIEIGQLFQNLITNAIKFQRNGAHPHIEIRSKNVDGKWQFSVSDNGIGIAPAHFNKIFAIFQRLHGNNEYQGNGIGLANCKKIVELHQGRIWVESTLGEGTIFNFTIPNLYL